MRTPETQKVAAFTGEGAYHGSTKGRDGKPCPEIPETAATTIGSYKPSEKFNEFTACFLNRYAVKALLPVPTQQELQEESKTFVWRPFAEAKAEADPITKSVLEAMEPFLERKKRFAYIDSKVQFFRKGDLPVDSKLWHVDGTIAVRDQRAHDLGYSILHDMKARFTSKVAPPKYLAYQSSTHCATEFATAPLFVELPELVPNFDLLDERVRALGSIQKAAQPAGSIVSFDGFSLHRAVPAKEDGWRLWIRCIETDREVFSDPTMQNCYNTVFQQRV